MQSEEPSASFEFHSAGSVQSGAAAGRRWRRLHIISMTPSAVAVVVLLAVLATSCYCSGSPTSSHQIVKSPVYPNVPARLRSFRDDPIHGPVVAVQAWYTDDNKVFGLQATFLDGYRSPLRGYAKGNTTTATFDPNNDKVFTVAGVIFANIGPDGTTGAVLVGLRKESVLRRQPGEVEYTFAGGHPELSAAIGYGPAGVILGLTGTVDHTGLTQLGYIIQARPLSFHQSASDSAKLFWPQKEVVRGKSIPRLPDRLHSFDDGVTGEHGEIVGVTIWTLPSEGIRGIQATFQDGYTSPLRGFATGTNVDSLTFEPESNPLLAVGARGRAFDLTGVYGLAALVFFAGGSSPPMLSPVYGKQLYAVYSDSPDGKIVGFFGTTSDTALVQLGVHFVSPANGLLVSAGPYPRVSPSAAVPFDHTGDNVGVSNIDVYHDNFIGVRGLRFTYVTRSGFKVTTPVYGQKQGSHNQVQFDYSNNPLVNVAVFVSNVLAGKGEVGLVGVSFITRKDDVIGVFGVVELDYFNVTDGTKRIVGFHGQADTVVNALGAYTAPL